MTAPLSQPKSKTTTALLGQKKLVGAAATSLIIAGTLFLAIMNPGIPAQEEINGEQDKSTFDFARVLNPFKLMSLPPAEPVYVSMQPVLPQSTLKTMSLKVDRGDTLMNMLVDAGAKRQDAYYAIESMSGVFNPKRLKVGQNIGVTFRHPPAYEVPTAQQKAEPILLAALNIKTDVDKRVTVKRNDTEFTSQEIVTELTERFTQAEGSINSSLYLAALNSGIPDATIIELIRMFSYDIDFQREIRRGDQFKVFFSRHYDPEGTPLRNGKIAFAQMTVRGKDKGYYLFTTSDDKISDYYDAKGQSSKKFLMRTPVEGARISSKFGRRKHPVLGYAKAHRGTDFAAPRGTPIMAAGNGVVERASRYGSYGNYVRIRHANGYKTAYAHMSRYGAGIKSGRRVKQGQTIGYVGATGRVTGAHLHYEVHYHGQKVNPLTIKVPTGRKLKGKIFEQFKLERTKIDANMIAATAEPIMTVEAVQDKNKS